MAPVPGEVGQSGVSRPFDCELGGILRFVSSTASPRTADGLRPVKSDSEIDHVRFGPGRTMRPPSRYASPVAKANLSSEGSRHRVDQLTSSSIA